MKYNCDHSKHSKPSLWLWWLIQLLFNTQWRITDILNTYWNIHVNWWLNPLCFRSAYPLGLPEEFVFVAVMRMTASTLNKNWNIWQMQDVNGNEQLAVRLNRQSKSLDFTFPALEAGRQDVTFGPVASLFNDQWHKVLLEVSRGSVTLFVDCAMIESQTIPARQKVSLDGFTLIGKLKNNPVMATPVRLQATAQITVFVTKVILQTCMWGDPTFWTSQ